MTRTLEMQSGFTILPATVSGATASEESSAVVADATARGDSADARVAPKSWQADEVETAATSSMGVLLGAAFGRQAIDQDLLATAREIPWIDPGGIRSDNRGQTKAESRIEPPADDLLSPIGLAGATTSDDSDD